jgi:hypothetical protein
MDFKLNRLDLIASDLLAFLLDKASFKAASELTGE